MLTRTTLASLTLLAASAQAGTGRNCSESHVAPRMHKRAPNTANKVVVQMFGWSWKSIAAECESFLGPAGVGFVQVNPPQEHLSGDQWWVDYQAVSYQIQSKRGSRADFAEMVGRCKNVGVNVAVDAIWNHMAGVENGEFAWRERRYQRLTSSKVLAQPEANSLITTTPAYTAGTISTIAARMTNNDDIQNWGDRNQIWNCELVNLADLNTGSDYVRDKLAAFTNDLLSMGVEGLRIDAAKHISPDDIRQIMNRLSRRPAFITQEIVDGDGSMGGMYTQFGDVQEFRYPQALKAAFGGGGIAGLRGVENRGWLASNSANVFVTNHDQERGGDALTYKSGSNTYNLAHVFMLSYPYGTPTILSSYVFDNNDAGAPNGAYGTCYGEGGVNGWLCQHRWTPIAGMIKFFNKVGTNDLNNWVQGSKQQIAFGRGKAGFVVINNEDWAWTGTFKNTLPSATYCDVITGKKSGNSCTGGKVTISNGSFTVTVPGRSAVAYHIGAKY